ncbi:hypothetical protein X798_01447 [Onchocerca flexuosa]|uniref:RRM domain-containing protein n=1 Tax=Onchocerca flexuosa TaxID=387005 RepID=A0A238C2A4_9BILA|nr:hypothetical protein X798_01447 [Onchocerca flexuosa]
MAGKRDCRVFVGNLPSDVKQRDLEDIFYKYGRINFIDIKFTRDVPFAFVEFDDSRDARDAVHGRNGYDFDGCRIRVELTRGVGPRGPGGRPLYGPDSRSPRRGPSSRRTGYRVVISGLPDTGSWQDLKDHMRDAGEICYADVFRDGTGVVEYTNYEDMKYALRKLDDTKFKSHEGEVTYIRVKEANVNSNRSRSRSYTPRRTRTSPKYSPTCSRSRSRSRSSHVLYSVYYYSFETSMAGRRDCRVYIGNLPPDIRQRDLEDLFYKYGHINFIDVKLTRGAPFAFIEFDDPRDARDAIRGRDGYELDGCRIRVEMTRGVGPRGPGGRPLYGPDRGERDRRPPPPRGPPRRSGYRVLVTGLPVTGSWQDLKDHMREAGDICYADVFKDGTGVVEYTRQDDMKYAIKKLDDTKFKSHEGETSYIRVKEAAIDDRYRSRSRSPRGSPNKHCLCEDIDRDNQRPLHSIQPNQQNVFNATPNLRLYQTNHFRDFISKNNVEGTASISTPTSASTSPESPIPDLLECLCNALRECLAAKR